MLYTLEADNHQLRATNPDANGKKADKLPTGEKIKGVINVVVDHVTPTDA